MSRRRDTSTGDSLSGRGTSTGESASGGRGSVEAATGAPRGSTGDAETARPSPDHPATAASGTATPATSARPSSHEAMADVPAGGHGRTRDRQTRRTKRALLAAADEIFEEGRVPTVADVAERADVARATAYRYFPTQEALLLESTFLGDSGPMRSIPALAEEVADPAGRVAEAVRRGAEWTLGRETRLRTILRMSLEHDDVRRPGRRRGYIAQLLADVRDRLPPAEYERLAAALTLLFGIDPIVSLRDNGDIPPERIPEMLAWAAHELVRAALDRGTG